MRASFTGSRTILFLAAGVALFEAGCATAPSKDPLGDEHVGSAESREAPAPAATQQPGMPPPLIPCSQQPSVRGYSEFDGGNCPSPLVEATVSCRYEPTVDVDNPVFVSGFATVQFAGGGYNRSPGDFGPYTSCTFLCGTKHPLLSDGDLDPKATQCLNSAFLYDHGCPDVPARRFITTWLPANDPLAIAAGRALPGTVDASAWCLSNLCAATVCADPPPANTTNIDDPPPGEVQGCGCDPRAPAQKVPPVGP